MEFARSVAVAPAVGALIAAVAGAGLRGWLPPQSLPAILVEGALVGIVYLIAVWMFGFNHAARERYSAYGRHLFITVLQRRAAAPLA